MNEKQSSGQLEWQSLSKDEQETLKGFFVLLHQIDRRLKSKEEKKECDEDHKTRDCSDQA